ncbi:MAG: ACT domain-containing protein [Anaerolineae bacterium]|nr:ACT domain-containing protein [Anaerolineae bacterium]
MTTSLRLSLFPSEYAVCQLPPDTDFPSWVRGGELLSLTRTADELSIVCLSSLVPADVKAEYGWRAIKVLGSLDFSLVGVLAHLTDSLAKAGVSIFALSTFDTDYILVKSNTIDRTIDALRKAGYEWIQE